MEENIVSKPRLIKTPVHKIPIGEPVKNPDGHYSIHLPFLTPALLSVRMLRLPRRFTTSFAAESGESKKTMISIV